MNTVFVDTGYLLALEIANDQHHQVATRHWRDVVTALPRLTTTSYVFDEVVTFFNSRRQHRRPRYPSLSLTLTAVIVLYRLVFDDWMEVDGNRGANLGNATRRTVA